MKSKEQQTPTNERLNPHISGLAGIKNKGRERESEEQNPHSFDHLVMERAKVKRKEILSHNPNLLVGHHDRATKWHKAIPMVSSDAVVITRTKGMLWLKWYEHTSWLG
jgi:hypothetical protein